jgi:hypothetical protein
VLKSTTFANSKPTYADISSNILKWKNKIQKTTAYRRKHSSGMGFCNGKNGPLRNPGGEWM